MKRNVRIYFEKPIDEVTVQTMLDQEFGEGEASILKIDDDRRGVMYALISVSSDIPDGVLRILDAGRNKVVSVVKESHEKELSLEKEDLIEIEEEVHLSGTDITLEKGDRILLIKK